MEKKKIIEIVSRVYGLYLLVQLPLALTGLIAVFSLEQAEFVKYPVLYRSWAVISPILYLIIASILISKADYISNLVVGKSDVRSENIPDTRHAHTKLSFWITLLGLYFLITSFSSMVRDLIRHPLYSGDSFAWSLLLSQGLIFLASIYMVFRSKQLESFILKKSGR